MGGGIAIIGNSMTVVLMWQMKQKSLKGNWWPDSTQDEVAA
jgi:hypothetical protein